MNSPVEKQEFLKYTLLKSELLATGKTTAKTLNSGCLCHTVSYGADAHPFL